MSENGFQIVDRPSETRGAKGRYVLLIEQLLEAAVDGKAVRIEGCDHGRRNSLMSSISINIKRAHPEWAAHSSVKNGGTTFWLTRKASE